MRRQGEIQKNSDRAFLCYQKWVTINDENYLNELWSYLFPFIDYALQILRKRGYHPDHDSEDDMRSYALRYLMDDLKNKRYTSPSAKAFTGIMIKDATLTMHRWWVSRGKIIAVRERVNPEWMVSKTTTGQILGNIYLNEVPRFIIRFVKERIRFPRLSPEYRLCFDIVVGLIHSRKVNVIKLATVRGVHGDPNFFYLYARFLCKLALYELKENESYDVLSEFRFEEMNT